MLISLETIADTFGPRFSGSQNLENALDYIKELATSEDGLRVTEEPTMVPKWVRGDEWGYMISPRLKKLHLVGLGMSTNTKGQNITAPIFVVSGYPDLQANCSKAQGKIVVFNTIFTTYGNTVSTRTNAAVWGASCGAVRSIQHAGQCLRPSNCCSRYSHCEPLSLSLSLSVSLSVSLHRILTLDIQSPELFLQQRSCHTHTHTLPSRIALCLPHITL
jgi:hypothetical protein